MHFKRLLIAPLAFIFLGFATTSASNVKRHKNVIVPANKEVNAATLEYTIKLLKRQETLQANFRAEFTEILKGVSELIITLRNNTDAIKTGLLGEATPQEAKEVMPLRENHSKLIQDSARLWMTDERMIASTGQANRGNDIRRVIQGLQEQKNASEVFGRVVVSKMPASLQQSLRVLDSAAHLALRNAIGLWESRI